MAILAFVLRFRLALSVPDVTGSDSSVGHAHFFGDIRNASTFFETLDYCFLVVISQLCTTAALYGQFSFGLTLTVLPLHLWLMLLVHGRLTDWRHERPQFAVNHRVASAVNLLSVHVF